jgi:hypothetical protein
MYWALIRAGNFNLAIFILAVALFAIKGFGAKNRNVLNLQL